MRSVCSISCWNIGSGMLSPVALVTASIPRAGPPFAMYMTSGGFESDVPAAVRLELHPKNVGCRAKPSASKPAMLVGTGGKAYASGNSLVRSAVFYYSKCSITKLSRSTR